MTEHHSTLPSAATAAATPFLASPAYPPSENEHIHPASAEILIDEDGGPLSIEELWLSRATGLEGDDGDADEQHGPECLPESNSGGGGSSSSSSGSSSNGHGRGGARTTGTGLLSDDDHADDEADEYDDWERGDLSASSPCIRGLLCCWLRGDDASAGTRCCCGGTEGCWLSSAWLMSFVLDLICLLMALCLTGVIPLTRDDVSVWFTPVVAAVAAINVILTFFLVGSCAHGCRCRGIKAPKPRRGGGLTKSRGGTATTTNAGRRRQQRRSGTGKSRRSGSGGDGGGQVDSSKPLLLDESRGEQAYV